MVSSLGLNLTQKSVDLLLLRADASRPEPKFAEDAMRRASKTVVKRLPSVMGRAADEALGDRRT